MYSYVRFWKYVLCTVQHSTKMVHLNYLRNRLRYFHSVCYDGFLGSSQTKNVWLIFMCDVILHVKMRLVHWYFCTVLYHLQNGYRYTQDKHIFGFLGVNYIWFDTLINFLSVWEAEIWQRSGFPYKAVYNSSGHHCDQHQPIQRLWNIFKWSYLKK